MSRRAALELQLAMVAPDIWELCQLEYSEQWTIYVPLP